MKHRVLKEFIDEYGAYYSGKSLYDPENLEYAHNGVSQAFVDGLKALHFIEEEE